MKEHFAKYKNVYLLAFGILAVIAIIILIITVFKRHDDTSDRKYLDLYIQTKDSLIAEKEKRIQYLQSDIEENKQAINYNQQKDSIVLLSIQRLVQRDRVLQKQQTDVATYINSLGHNADSIRRAFREFN